MQPFNGLVAGEGADDRLEEAAIKAEIDLRHLPRGGETALVFGVWLDDGPDVGQGSLLEAHDPVADDHFRMDRLGALARDDRLVKAGRQHVDQIDVGSKFLMLLFRHPARHENAEMADVFMDGVDDGLAVDEQVVVLFIKIDDPAERLLWRGNIVALGAKADDRRADAAQVDPDAIAGDDFGGGEPVADEQIIDDPLHFLGVELDMAAPPFLEFEVARPLGVDLAPEVVILGPIGV